MSDQRKERCATCHLWVAPPPKVIIRQDLQTHCMVTSEEPSDAPGKCRWMPTPIEKMSDDLCGQWRERE